MTYLLATIAVILATSIGLMYVVMKRIIPWRFKAFIYGALIFAMLISIFLTFAWYEKAWKVTERPAGDVHQRSTVG